MLHGSASASLLSCVGILDRSSNSTAVDGGQSYASYLPLQSPEDEGDSTSHDIEGEKAHVVVPSVNNNEGGS